MPVPIQESHVVSGVIQLEASAGAISGAIIFTSVSGNSVNTSISGNTVNVNGVSVSGNIIQTSVSGNIISTSVSGNIIQTSVSGNNVVINDGALVQTSISGNVVVIAPQTVSSSAIVILRTVGVSGMAINILPDQPTISGMMFVGYNIGPGSSSSEWFVGGSTSGETPFASIDPSTGVRTVVGWDQPLDILIPVTNMNQLAVTSFSGAKGILSLWAITD